jgi:hypothetical protein
MNFNTKYFQAIIKHLTAILTAMAIKGFTAKMTDIEEVSTVNVKTKPLSQAARPIEKDEFHHSHLLGKQVWGRQVMAAMISSGKMELNYDIHRYDKTKQNSLCQGSNQ